MLARSEMQKKRIWLEYAIGVYPRRTYEASMRTLEDEPRVVVKGALGHWSQK